MKPYIDVFGSRISTFTIFMIAALIVCLGVLVVSDKYDILSFFWIKKSLGFGLAGALLFGKLLFALTRVTSNVSSPIEYFNGFVFYGGLIGFTIGIFLFCRIYNKSFVDLLDVCLSILPLGQAVGRIGCYFNGCCYGKDYDGILAVRYIVNDYVTKVFPTWFFESAFCFILFMSMFCISRRLYLGIYASVYLISYSVFRFIIEFFRGDDIRGVLWGISTSQYISVLLFVFGLALLKKSIKEMKYGTIIKGRINYGI